MKTKERILQQSLELFNRDGVEKVTTRHIAKELGISQGNLHYHFPNKDEIILKLFAQLIDEVKNAARYVPNDLFAKEEVLRSMTENFTIMFEYRFFFKDNEAVWRRLPSIKEMLLALLSSKKQEIEDIIQYYKSQGMFRSEISNDQIDHLSSLFLFTISSWLGANEYVGVGQEPATYFSQFTFRLWLPYLTAEEMESWEVLLVN